MTIKYATTEDIAAIATVEAARAERTCINLQEKAYPVLCQIWFLR